MYSSNRLEMQEDDPYFMEKKNQNGKFAYNN